MKMASSDSEDFESADEGVQLEARDRHKKVQRKTSTNDNDSGQESDTGSKSTEASLNRPRLQGEFANNAGSSSRKEPLDPSEGWDDFDVDDDPVEKLPEDGPSTSKAGVAGGSKKLDEKSETAAQPTKEATAGDGWDDFDDWDTADTSSNQQVPTNDESASSDRIQSATDRLSDLSVKESQDESDIPKSNSWGWSGWGVNSLLNTATAGISTITSHVSQGISSVSTALETSIGAPNPEELVRKQAKESEAAAASKDATAKTSAQEAPEGGEEKHEEKRKEQGEVSDGASAFGTLISGVSHLTKFVENTGTKVIAGSLDTLETIGKKTMEVLQDGDPGLAKKRAMLGLETGEKPVLSQLLREAKERADEEDKIKEQKREAKEVHYETLFDDFGGLVHLEALEMLSKQLSMRIEELIKNAEGAKRQELKETLQQVSELCELPEADDEEEDPEENQVAPHERLENRLQEATQDVGIKINFDPIVNECAALLAWLNTPPSEDPVNARAVYKRAITALAQSTALCVEVYHKTAELLLVKTRRSTADEADGLTLMTSVLMRFIRELATEFTKKLASMLPTNEDQTQVNTYITNIFLEAENSSTYIQNAFQLTLPILQIGAA